MKSGVEVQVPHLFDAVTLIARGPIAWGTPCEERRPGVYVVTTNAEGIVYIGRTRRPLHDRLNEFYRHRHGDPSPHAGGQEILLLSGPLLLVYWSYCDDPRDAERAMIEEYEHRYGQLPHGNRKRGDT